MTTQSIHNVFVNALLADATYVEKNGGHGRMGKKKELRKNCGKNWGQTPIRYEEPRVC